MKKYSLTIASLIAFGASTALADVTCKATEQIFMETGVKTQQLPLVMDLNDKDYIRMQVDLGERNYSMIGYKATNDFQLFITEGPEYLRGVVSRGRLDSRGEISFSIVDREKVYRVECKKK